eukprot:gene1317-32670_t
MDLQAEAKKRWPRLVPLVELMLSEPRSGTGHALVEEIDFLMQDSASRKSDGAPVAQEQPAQSYAVDQFLELLSDCRDILPICFVKLQGFQTQTGSNCLLAALTSRSSTISTKLLQGTEPAPSPNPSIGSLILCYAVSAALDGGAAVCSELLIREAIALTLHSARNKGSEHQQLLWGSLCCSKMIPREPPCCFNEDDGESCGEDRGALGDSVQEIKDQVEFNGQKDDPPFVRIFRLYLAFIQNESMDQANIEAQAASDVFHSLTTTFAASGGKREQFDACTLAALQTLLTARSQQDHQDPSPGHRQLLLFLRCHPDVPMLLRTLLEVDVDGRSKERKNKGTHSMFDLAKCLYESDMRGLAWACSQLLRPEANCNMDQRLQNLLVMESSASEFNSSMGQSEKDDEQRALLWPPETLEPVLFCLLHDPAVRVRRMAMKLVENVTLSQESPTMEAFVRAIALKTRDKDGMVQQQAVKLLLQLPTPFLRDKCSIAELLHVSRFAKKSNATTHAERLEDFYKPQAKEYDNFRSRFLWAREPMLTAVASCTYGRSDLVWVDLGGGTGENIELMAAVMPVESFRTVYVVDLCHSLCQQAKMRFQEDSRFGNVVVVEGDACTFELPEGVTADIVTFSYSLSMIPPFHAAVDNALALLTPKTGILGVCDFGVSQKYDEPQRQMGWARRMFWSPSPPQPPAPAQHAFIGEHLSPLRGPLRIAKPPAILFSLQYDNKRGSYNLKEAKLSQSLSRACGIPVNSPDYQAAINWRSVAAGKSMGLFVDVMYERLMKKHCSANGVLTVGDVNARLDQLVAADAGEGKIQANLYRFQGAHHSVGLITRCTAEQMRILIHIIMRQLRFHLSPEFILRDYHPDSVDMYGTCMDLQRVIEELKDLSYRRPQAHPGSCIRPQLADRCNGTALAFKKMDGQPFTVEFKFDGERMQLRPPSCFEPFGGIRSVINAARDGKHPDEIVQMNHWGDSVQTSNPDYEPPALKDVEIVFIAFDERQVVLSRLMKPSHKEGAPAAPHGSLPHTQTKAHSQFPQPHTSTIFIDPAIQPPTISTTFTNFHRNARRYSADSSSQTTRRERQAVLSRLIKPSHKEGVPAGPHGSAVSRMIALIPDQVALGGQVLSRTGSTLADITNMMEWVEEKQLKPDYIHDPDIDAIIIGGCYGTKKNAGV